MVETQLAVVLARFAVRAQTLIESYRQRLTVLDLNEAQLTLLREDAEYQRAVISDVERVLPDGDLLVAHALMMSRPSSPDAQTLLAEIDRRGLEP